MFAKFKSVALASLIGLGALAAAPANADTLTFGFSDDGVSVGVTTVDHRVWRERDDRPGGPRSDWDGPRRDRGDGWDRPRGCSPWRAVEKAERMGIHRARVVDAGRRGVVVKGRQYGERVQIVFGNAPHCPVRGMY